MKSAKQGYPLAKCDIGIMYRNGEGVKQDYKEAAKWLIEAAEGGDGLAQFHIGKMYVQGNGVEKDFSKALEWFEKAHENGVKEADEFICYFERTLR